MDERLVRQGQWPSIRALEILSIAQPVAVAEQSRKNDIIHYHPQAASSEAAFSLPEYFLLIRRTDLCENLRNCYRDLVRCDALYTA